MTIYTNWYEEDKIKICASIDEWCSTSTFIYVNDINIAKYPDDISCTYGYERGCGLHLNNVELTFKLVKCSGSTNGTSCNPQIIYKTLGTAKTNSNGVCGLEYTITKQDRLDYESQKTDDVYKVMACITNSDGQTTQSSLISYVTSSIIINEALHLKPTHYVELQLALLQDETANLIEQNITTISDNIPLFFELPPAPWTYINTTFDKTNGKLILWYNNPTTSLDISKYDIIADFMALLDSIWQWIAMLVGIILILIAAVVASPIWAIIALFSGLVILGATIWTLATQKKELKQEVTTLEVSLSQAQLPSKIKELVVTCWTNSDKTQKSCFDCRLDGYRKGHIEYIIGYKIKYPTLQSGFYTELDSEIQLFTTNTDIIISDFYGQTYSETVCNNSYVSIDTEVTNSSTRINAIVSKYIVDGHYIIKCSDFVTSDLCNRSGCMWYYSKCIDKSDCLIVEPFNNTCILKTGDIVMAGIIGIGALSAIYYIPPLLSVGSNYLNDFSKTMSTKTTETSTVGINANKSIYKKQSSMKK